jgi:beta-galactosidase GanA
MGIKHMEITSGVKHDQEKLDWTLVSLDELAPFVRVLMHGAKKYSPDNWRRVEPATRYFAAAIRHLQAWQAGERIDPESNEPHLAHALASIYFLMVKDKK